MLRAADGAVGEDHRKRQRVLLLTSCHDTSLGGQAVAPACAGRRGLRRVRRARLWLGSSSALQATGSELTFWPGRFPSASESGLLTALLDRPEASASDRTKSNAPTGIAFEPVSVARQGEFV